jgi:hypothetical protein
LEKLHWESDQIKFNQFILLILGLHWFTWTFMMILELPWSTNHARSKITMKVHVTKEISKITIKSPFKPRKFQIQQKKLVEFNFAAFPMELMMTSKDNGALLD